MTTFAELPVLITQLDYDFPATGGFPSRCSLASNPVIGWAIATGLEPLLSSVVTLAAQICQDYDIHPSRLLLLVRQARFSGQAEDNDQYHLVQFIGGQKDMFGTVSFWQPSLHKLSDSHRDSVLAQLAEPKPLIPASWLALAPLGSGEPQF